MNSNHKSKKQRHTSLDGFIHTPSDSNQGTSLGDFNQHSGNKKSKLINDDSLKIGRIDDFSAAEGFVAGGQAPISRPGDRFKPAELSSLDEPEEELIKPAKKHRFFKRKSKGHKKKPHTKHHKFKVGLKVAGALTLLIILLGGGLFLKGYLKLHNILKGGSDGAAALNKNVDPTLLKGEGDGRVNILVLGKGGPGHDGPDLTDTLLLASIDPIAKETALVSVPRDLWVKTTGSGQSKINAVYANAKSKVLNSYTTKQQTDAVKKQAQAAGIKAIEDTITTVLGIPIHYYVMVDFEAFRESVDAVHGIDINVKTQLYDASVAWENNNNPLIAAVGMQHFDGKKALLYSRSRHGSSRGDFDRTERQREVITALKSKVLSVGTFANPLKINQLIDAFGDHVSTDFTLNEIMRVYEISKEVDNAKIQSIGLADPPNDFVTTGNVNGQSVVVPRAGTFSYAAIQSYIRNQLRDSFLKSENASILILNGTKTTGLATVKSTELKSYGYNVTQVGDAPTKTYTQTTLIDMTAGVKKYTKNYLEKRLGVTAATTLPDPAIVPGTADFVIILGTSEPTAAR